MTRILGRHRLHGKNVYLSEIFDTSSTPSLTGYFLWDRKERCEESSVERPILTTTDIVYGKAIIGLVQESTLLAFNVRRSRY